MGGTGRAAGAGTATALSTATGRSVEPGMVAMAAERVMATKKSHVLYGQRRKVLNHARDLARSGEHADHQTILPQLAALEDFQAVRSVFEDRAICAQLDLLCVRARNREGPLPELASRRTGVRLTRAPERESNTNGREVRLVRVADWRKSASLWRTEGGSPWLRRLLCAGISTVRDCAGSPNRARTPPRPGVFWRSLRSTTAAHERTRPGSAASPFRSCGTGCCASTSMVPKGSSTARRRATPQAERGPTP